MLGDCLGKSVIVVGMRGVGKSTVLHKAVEKLDGVKIVNYGDVLLQLVVENNYAKNRDEMRMMPNPIQLKVNAETWSKLAQEEGSFMLDTHAFVEHTGRFIPGLPIEDVEKLKGLCGLFYLDADNDTIRSRAAKDHTRIREGQGDVEMNNYRYASISALSYLSTRLNIPLYIIQNKEGMLDQTVDIFVQHLHDAFGDKK